MNFINSLWFFEAWWKICLVSVGNKRVGDCVDLIDDFLVSADIIILNFDN